MVQQISILYHFLKDEKPKCQTLSFNSEMREVVFDIFTEGNNFLKNNSIIFH